MLPSYLDGPSQRYKLERAKVLSLEQRQQKQWRPIPNSPQEMAYHSQADELFYGGAAGGGKSDLLLGLALTAHRHSIIFRRVFPSTRALIERSRQIFNPDGITHGKDSYNESLHIWRMASGRILEFGSVQHEKNVQDYKGRPHDLYGWDELPEFSEYIYRYVNAWNRTTIKGQRCRVVATGNPPTHADGEWVIRYWSPWLDPQHSYPAKPGELRYYVTIAGQDFECENGDPFLHKQETLYPRSRSFIPARLDDNPYLRDTDYISNLNALPEPLRSQMLYGDFTLKTIDDSWQVLPTAWLNMAQERWRSATRPYQQTGLGMDIAHGGDDKTVIAPLYGNYFDELISYPGRDTPRGNDIVRVAMQALESPNTTIAIDAVGYGASGADALQAIAGLNVIEVNAGAASNERDQSGLFGFVNIRSAMYWRLREALNPDSDINIALPPDRELIADLAAARYTVSGGRYAIEPKENIKKRLGRSPDRGEAVMLIWWANHRPQGTIQNVARGRQSNDEWSSLGW